MIMPPITPESLMPLETYAKARQDYRTRVMAHKKQRTVALGPDITLIFEDELTIRYQVQEMLRIERIFEEAGIRDELDTYNPLVPDGNNWKVTMLIEYPDVVERTRMLQRLIGIEDRVFVQVAGFSLVHAIADEDLDRSTDTKTAAVHFLRFELGAEMIAALKRGAALTLGVDHPEYRARVEAVTAPVRDALVNDLR